MSVVKQEQILSRPDFTHPNAVRQQKKDKVNLTTKQKIHFCEMDSLVYTLCGFLYA